MMATSTASNHQLDDKVLTQDQVIYDASTEESKRDLESAQIDLESPQIEKAPLQRWNSPKVNIFRMFSANFSFIIMGMNDSAYGALIPYLEVYYNVSYTVISLVFLAPFIGYTLAAILNNRIHMKYGQLGVAVISPICKLVAYTVSCVHPPYAVLPIIFIFSGFANGIQDGGWNAWIGGMENSNELLGILHGSYGLGATIAPLVATAMITKANLQWFTFYYIMVGLAVVEFFVCVLAFRKADGKSYRAANPVTNTKKGHSRTRESLKMPVTWIVAVFLLLYVGVEVSLGGWMVTFMLRVRNGEAFASGMVVTGFWLGLTIGRVILGFVTGKIGEKLSIAVYMTICLALQLCFWLIPSFIASAVFAGWLGFFLGPLFPAAIVVATKLLPSELHVSAIGFAAAFGGGGAAVLPFAVGAIAQAKGVQVLQPIAFALVAAILALWCILPGGFSKRGLDEEQKRREDKRAGIIEETVVEKEGFRGKLNKVRHVLGLDKI